MRKSKSELAAALNLSRQKVAKHLAKSTAPRPDADGLYDLAEVRRFVRGEQRTSKGYATGDLLEAKVEKLRLECRELREKMRIGEPSIGVSQLRGLLWEFLNQVNAEQMSATNDVAYTVAGLSTVGEVLKALRAQVLTVQHRLAAWCEANAVPIRGAKAEAWPVEGHPSFAWGKVSQVEASEPDEA